MSLRLLLNRLATSGMLVQCLLLSACGFMYHAEAIEGRVMDSQTEKPLEGVIVVAHWQLMGGFEGGVPIKQLQIFEATTDQNGRYQFPAWGPKFAVIGHLGSQSPRILMFKPGYKYLGLDNQWYEGRDSSKFDYNKKTVKLDPFKGTPAKYAEHLSSLSSSLWSIGFDIGYHSGDYCGWRSFPQMLRALNRLEAEFRSARVVEGTVVSSFKSNDKILKEKGCGSILEVIGGADE